MSKEASAAVEGGYSARVFTIPPGVSFVDALASSLLARYAGDDFALADTRILLPNRRSVRALEAAFVRCSGGRAMLLPRIEPIGEIEEETLSGRIAKANDVFEIAPAIDDFARLLELMPLVGSFLRPQGGRGIGAAHLLKLAEALARWQDAMDFARCDPDRLDDLVPEEFADHWRDTLEFLKIVRDHWMNGVKERCLLSPARRRVMLLERLAADWRENPPKGPVIAAGSTGSVPATADLLAVIARLPQGAVILPGLDRTLDNKSWKALAEGKHPTHPQAMLARLLAHLGLRRDHVRDWPLTKADRQRVATRASRMTLIARAMHPTNLDPDKERPGPNVLAGLQRIDCRERSEEALVAALLMRETLEEPGRTAALVTADRVLARAVRTQLARWNIRVDDSAGEPLSLSPPARFLQLIASAVAEDFAPVPLLSLLKHPLCALGKEPGKARAFARRLDRFEHKGRFLLRGPRITAGLAGLLAEAKKLSLRKCDCKLISRLDEIFAPLAKLFVDGREERASLPELIGAHLAVAEALADTGTGDGAQRLWSGDAGEKSALVMERLREGAPHGIMVERDEYAGLITALLERESLRRAWGGHPRLQILGTIEARLFHADRMILAGLDEGSWPPLNEPDPWLNRRMRAELGLPPPERRIGQSAHDFVQACGAEEVWLLRAERIDGVPTTPSRWLQRLAVLCEGIENPHKEAEPLVWARALGRIDAVRPCPPPTPRPPACLRPKRISVTAVETLMRDPYSYYARHILGLDELPALDAETGPAERGILLHDILHCYLAKRMAREAPLDREGERDRLLAIARTAFDEFDHRPAVRAFWWPRFLRIAEAFVGLQKQRENDGVRPVLLESKTEMELLDGRVTLVAKADRIDRSPAGVEIIDYKTGTLPAQQRIAAGYAPQLPLEGWMLECGAFRTGDGETLSGPIAGLAFWKLKGTGKTAIEVDSIKNHEERIAEAAAGAHRLFKRYLLGDAPFLSEPRAGSRAYPAYAHLARRDEWAGLPELDPPGDDGMEKTG